MRLNTHARSLIYPVFAAVALAACSDSAGPTEKFNGPTGFTLLQASNPIDVTPDGSTVVVEDLMTFDNKVYFYDVATGVYTYKMTPGSPFMDFATGVSSDLKVSALTGDPASAGVWSEATGWVTMTPSFTSGCDLNAGAGWDISNDGHTMVGADWNGCTTQAMRWNETGGTWTSQQLELIGAPYPDSPNPQSNRATVVSGNGLVAAGWAQTSIVDRWPAVWQADGSGTLLASGVSDDTPGEILAINFDGSVMAGNWGGQAFIYRDGAANFIESLVADDPFAQTFPNAIAAGDQLVFGGSAGQAFVWDAAHGTRKLQDIATAAGIEIPQGVTLGVVKATSADGTIIIGQAFMGKAPDMSGPPGKAMSFVLKLPASAFGL